MQNIMPVLTEAAKLRLKKRLSYTLLICGQDGIDLTGLIKGTGGFPREEILKEIAPLQEKFGITGDADTGFKLSDDPEQRLAMCKYEDSLYPPLTSE